MVGICLVTMNSTAILLELILDVFRYVLTKE